MGAAMTWNAPLAACALDYALAGVTSIEEVLRVTATLAEDEVTA